MKRKTKCLSALLLTVLIMSGMVLPANAVRNIWNPMGDADLDKTVSVLDATKIQRTLAGMDHFNRLQTVLADVNSNTEVDILDATIIQRELADLDSGLRDENGNPITITNQLFYYEVSSVDLTAAYEGDHIAAGEPVTFIAEAKTIAASLLPITYEFRVRYNDEDQGSEKVIRARSDAAECTYVFEKPGDYSVDVYAYNAADICLMTSKVIFVTED